jgi:hypothetical protein
MVHGDLRRSGGGFRYRASPDDYRRRVMGKVDGIMTDYEARRGIERLKENLDELIRRIRAIAIYLDIDFENQPDIKAVKRSKKP